MADTAQNTNNTTIRSFLLAKKLTGSNFTNWYRNLRIVLRYDKKIKFVKQPAGPLLDPKTADPDTIDKYYEYVNLEQEVACLMLSIKAFHACKQEEGQTVSSYLLKMKSYLDTLERLGYAMPNELGVSVILNSLNKDYHQFVQNYNLHSMGKTIAELHAMLKLHEKGCGTHICNNLQGLRESQKLKHGALSLYIGNGMRVAVEAIGSFDLILPSGLIIVLDKCCFAPSITRGVVSISCLVNNGYIHTFTNYGISVSKDNVFYFNAILRDGIYEIDMHNLYPIVSSMFNVSNKRVKYSLDSSYLWYCRLGHINKKRMDKLQRDGVLQLTHDESLEKCKSCIFGKIARKSFPHQVERAKDLLGLIHTDVCGPFWTVSREGASYFITFINDFSRYGYVYTMKHKHESDEGLELIQKEDTKPSENTSEEHNEVAPIVVDHQNVKVPIRRSARIPQAPDRYGFYVDVEEYVLGDLNEPPNYKAALSYPESDKWLEVMNTKMQSMKDNQVWIFVELPPNGRTVRSKWIFKKKTDMDGNVNTFKVCLVAKGYTHTYDGETFSPVADIRAIRILLAIAVFYDYEIWQMDVKTAFLNGHLSKDVYMMQPKGFVDPKHPNKVCKLPRSIYGLMQASRS
ncbi:retrotransposon protein, putative, ty1-copia subclass [Tanacetum coccineum]